MTHARGTTLVEVVVYIGLLGLIATSSILLLVQITEGSGRLEIMLARQDEASFVLEKIIGELAQGATVTSPLHGGRSSTLKLLSAAGTDVTFALEDSRIVLTRGGGAGHALSGADIPVTLFEVINGNATSTMRMTIASSTYEQTF